MLRLQELILFGILRTRLQDEMNCWWNHHSDSLPVLTVEDKQEIEYMTGKLPLLLKELLRFKGRMYDEIKGDLLSNGILQTIRHGAKGFTERKLGEFRRDYDAHKKCVGIHRLLPSFA